MDSWNTITETTMRKSIPVLSKMSMKDRVITHIDQDETYCVVVKPNVGMVVLFGPMLFSDQCWTLDNNWTGSEESQQLKCKHPAVRTELKKLQDSAERGRVPKENVILVDCSESACVDEVAIVVQNAFAQDIPFSVITGHVLAFLPNHVGLALTKIFKETTW
jgi:hypothetical protein